MEKDPYTGMILLTFGLGLSSIMLALVTFFALYRKKLITKDAKLKQVEFEKERLMHRKQIEDMALVNDAEEREKERIARNLHDTLIPLISNTGKSLEMNLREYQVNNFNLERGRKDIEVLEQVGIMLRSISHDLMPPYLLSFGLIAALKDFIEQTNNATSGRASFENQTEYRKELPFSMPEQLNIYRVCLEVLNNLNKHSRYSFLMFVICKEAGKLVFEIQHDGLGLTTTEIETLTANSKGLGLKSIQTRVLLLGAELNYEIENEVSTIRLAVPLRSGSIS